MSTVSSLETLRDNYLTLLTDLSVSPKPSYSLGDRSISWLDYQKFLIEQVNLLNEQIQALSPFEIRTIHI